ncbi:MAG: lipid A biosynthesis acyltransferase [Gammaproteobacteria bacterium]
MSIEKSNKYRYRFQPVLLHPRYWLTWAGLGLFFLVTLLPLPIIDWLGGKLGNVAARKNKKRFNIAKINLSLCFPDKDDAEIEDMVFNHFQAQFRSLMHYFILWWRPVSYVRKKIHTAGFEKIEHYQQQGKRVIVLLTHNVGLEFAGAALSMEYKTIGPYKTMRNPVIDWMVAKGRLRFGVGYANKLFTREDGLRPLIREVRAGSVLGYFADEDLGEKSPVFAPFYGVQKATIPVLGRLAKACDAVVLPCVICYQEKEKRYLIKLLPKIENMPGDNDEMDCLNMNQVIERAVDFCPVQYLWTLRYFQTRPEGEASVYE